MDGQLSLFNIVQTSKEEYKDVMKELSTNCTDCRLGVLHSFNRGLVWRGNLEAKIAVLAEAPGDNEMEEGRPLVGKTGQMWEKWAKYIGLDTNTDTFITNVVQCQPEKVKEAGSNRSSQRPPNPDEVSACFGPRALRIFRTMPNLEVVLTLGWVAARAILGGEPGIKSHENKWFKTSIIPGVGVYCLIHPSFLVREPTQEKSERVKKGLDMFKREYLIANKIKPIVQHMEQEEQSLWLP